MNLKNTITIKRFGRLLALLGVTAGLLVTQLLAHGGFDHVIGTVVKVDNNVLTVKTAKGNVDVLLNEKTEITRDEQKALASDLAPGTRVVVDIPEGSKDKIAHSVKVGVSAAHAHSSQK